MPSLDYACPTCRAVGALTPSPTPRREANVFRCRECAALTTTPQRLVWAVYVDGKLDWLAWFLFEAEWIAKRTAGDEVEFRPVFNGQSVAPGGHWKGNPNLFPPLVYRIAAGGRRERRDKHTSKPDVPPWEIAERVDWITHNWKNQELLRIVARKVAALPASQRRALPRTSARTLAPLLLQSEDPDARLFAQRWLGRAFTS